jgi:hypothetical protein
MDHAFSITSSGAVLHVAFKPRRAPVASEDEDRPVLSGD